MANHRWVFGTRWVSGQIDRATWRNTLTYQIHPRIRLGVEYNPLADDVGALANVLVLPEQGHRPAILLGTSSDRIGTPEGRAFFGTLSKDLRNETGLPLAPYAGASFGTFDDRWRPITGLKLDFTDRLDSTILFDGVKFHPTLNYTSGRHAFGLILVRGRHPGLSYSISF